MATLNTLRTKFGIVLSAVIAFALLAFIFSLKSEMGFSGNDPIVAKINGKNVTYSEYQAEYDNIKNQNNVNESDEQQAQSLASAALQTFVTKNVLTPGFEKLGLNVTEVERIAMINGEIPTQAFYGAFADQTTGAYDRQGVTMFLMQAAGNPQAEAAWSYINDQARIEREGSKYISLLSGGVYVNSLEVKQGLNSSNRTYKGRWAGKRYTELSDSLFTVNSSEISKYYDKNKARYKKSPSRTISYAIFNVVATAEDKAAIESTVSTVGEEFAAAEDIRGYVRDNRYGSISSNFATASQLLTAEAEAFAAGAQYGPELKNNVWRVSRPVETRIAPDSMGIRIIALPYTSEALADSLLKALQGGADFAQAAAENSLHQQSAQTGGDVGIVPYSAFVPDMADALVSPKEGEIVKVEVGDMIQILQAYNIGKKSTQYKVAAIEYPVVASQATINKAHADAGLFAVDAKSDFAAAATKHSVSAQSAVISQGDRQLRGVDSSREIARWAHGAKRGDMSEIFKVDGGYAVAVLNIIDESEYTPLAEVSASIKSQLIKDKKFEALKKELAGATFDEQAASLAGGNSGEFENLNFAAYYVQGMGVEPRVVGAITSETEVNKLSAPIMGNNGLYIFEVSSIEESAEPLTADAERVRLQATAENMVEQMVLSALQDMSNIEDLRGMYF